MTEINANTIYDLKEYIFAMQQRNLVYNYNFLYFSNQKKDEATGIISFNHPDGWIYSDSGPNGRISKVNDSCQIVKSSDTSQMSLKQFLHEFPRWEKKLIGQDITARVHLNLETDSEVSVVLSDSIALIKKSLQAKGDVIIDLQLNMNIDSKELYIAIESSSPNAVININKVYANIGQKAIETLPCIVNGVIGERKQYISIENPPAEELSLCDKPKEITSDKTRLNSVLNYKFGKGANNASLLPDTRGLFSRSWNNGSTTDPDAKTRVFLGNSDVSGDFPGTQEEDEFKSHQHELNYSLMQTNSGDKAPVVAINQTVSSKTELEGGAETRPKNFAELYTIKWA